MKSVRAEINRLNQKLKDMDQLLDNHKDEFIEFALSIEKEHYDSLEQSL